MKKKLTKLNLLLTLVCLFAVTALKAQTVPGTTNLYCLHSTVKIGVTDAVTAPNYIWKRYDGQGTTGTATTLPGQTTKDLTDVPTAPGYYTYVSVALNSNDCESAPSTPVIVYILPEITAAINNSYTSNNICTTVLPTTGTLTAVPGTVQTVPEAFDATNDYTYKWFKNGTQVGTGITYTLTATDIGSATVTGTPDKYTVEINYSTHGCTAATSAPANINIIALPAQPNISVTP